jgi:hypothetical protein
MPKVKINYKIGDVALVNLGENDSNPIELKITSKDNNRLGIPMYGFEGKGDLRVGPNFIYDKRLKRYPRLSECFRN